MKVLHRGTKGTNRAHATTTPATMKIERHLNELPFVSRVSLGDAETMKKGNGLDLRILPGENQIGSVILQITQSFMKVRLIVYTSDPPATIAAAREYFINNLLGRKERLSWEARNQKQGLKALAQSLMVPGVPAPQIVQAS